MANIEKCNHFKLINYLKSYDTRETKFSNVPAPVCLHPVHALMLGIYSIYQTFCSQVPIVTIYIYSLLSISWTLQRIVLDDSKVPVHLYVTCTTYGVGVWGFMHASACAQQELLNHPVHCLYLLRAAHPFPENAHHVCLYIM